MIMNMNLTNIKKVKLRELIVYMNNQHLRAVHMHWNKMIKIKERVLDEEPD